MAAPRYVYRVLRDNEDPSEGLKARNPEEIHVEVSSHVNGKHISPYISTTATKKAIKAYYLLALKHYNKEKKEKKEKEKKETKKEKMEKTEKKEKEKSTSNQKTDSPGGAYFAEADTGGKVKYEKAKKFTVVRIDMDSLLNENRKEKKIDVFDLSTEEGRDQYLSGCQKLKNYAKKYDEVLIKGFIPAKCVEVIDIEAMSNDEFANEGYKKSDYTKDEVEELSDKAAKLGM